MPNLVTIMTSSNDDDDEDDPPPPSPSPRMSERGNRGAPTARFGEVFEVAADFMSPPPEEGEVSTTLSLSMTTAESPGLYHFVARAIQKWR